MLGRFRYSLRRVFVIFTIAIVVAGALGWQLAVVRTRQSIALQLYTGDKERGFRGRSYPGDSNDWSIRPFCVVKQASLVQYPPQSKDQLPAIRRWLGDTPYAVIVLRHETACPRARDVFPEAKIVVLNLDGATIRGPGTSQVWPVSWLDARWPGDL
jgi:hypothetical protein